MNIKKSSARNTLVQVVVFLVVSAGLIFYKKAAIATLVTSGDISKAGLLINGIILLLFLAGLFKIVLTLFRYTDEHHAVIKVAKNLKSNVLEPLAGVASKRLIAKRYHDIEWVTKHGSPVNHAALASSTNASESTRLTFIRFVHSTLILAGVFGTVVSLSMALIGASGLLNSPEGVKEMGLIISSMSSALSSTVVAIVCFFVFAYFYLRLNDSRIQLLNDIEEVTGLYILPKASHTEEGLIAKVSELTATLNQATERLLSVQHTFNHVGQTLQAAVDDLHGQVQGGGLNEIKDLIRKGFHLSEPVYDDRQDDNQKPQSTEPRLDEEQIEPSITTENDLITSDKGRVS